MLPVYCQSILAKQPYSLANLSFLPDLHSMHKIFLSYFLAINNGKHLKFLLPCRVGSVSLGSE